MYFLIFILVCKWQLSQIQSHILLPWQDHFEGFSNWSNVDELVINSMSGFNCNNYKLNSNTIINLTIT